MNASLLRSRRQLDDRPGPSSYDCYEREETAWFWALKNTWPPHPPQAHHTPLPPPHTPERRAISMPEEHGYSVADKHEPAVADRLPSNYESPKLVKSQIAAWTRTVQSAAVVTALFAGLAATVLGAYRMDPGMDNKTGAFVDALDLASFAAILVNSLTTLASLFFIDRLGDIDWRQALAGRLDNNGEIPPGRSSLDLLVDFGATRHIKLIFYQWLVYLIVGTVFLFLQVFLYMWVRNGTVLSVAIIVSALVGPAILALLVSAALDTRGGRKRAQNGTA
ncbi:hypothetical protein MKEN_00643700 [Mycena kentingensis (nom. inval.)]|nr:hypothetical protein MKEN_00643700 [Mycena kentingensis (nom. inval.)]